MVDELYQKSVKPRPRAEYLNVWVYRPLAHLVVKRLMNTRITPPQLVIFHTVLGLIAAHQLERNGGGWLAATLLIIKNILDNADGQLARAKNLTSETGRYLDTEMDLVVNFALFWAIGKYSGKMLFSMLAFAAMTLILSLDFQWEAAYRRARGQEFRAAPDQKDEHPVLLGILKGFYELFFAPQDRLIVRFDQWRYALLGIPSENNPAHEQAAQQSYAAGYTTAILSNFGLGTQVTLLCVFLVQRRPIRYLWAILLQVLAILGIQLFRETQTRNRYGEPRSGTVE
jgi:archaetidylinositol phosphate synthase